VHKGETMLSPETIEKATAIAKKMIDSIPELDRDDEIEFTSTDESFEISIIVDAEFYDVRYEELERLAFLFDVKSINIEALVLGGKPYMKIVIWLSEEQVNRLAS